MKKSLDFTLSDSQKNILALEMMRLGNSYRDENASSIGAKKALFSTLNLAQLRAIDRFKNEPETQQLLLISNCPGDPGTATPTDNSVPEKQSFVGEHITLGVGSLIGETVGYLNEKNGRMVHNLVPIKAGEKIQSNQSSRVFLNFHNDTVYDESLIYNKYNPDFLILYCVRQDPDEKAETIGVEARAILSKMTKAEQEKAFTAQFQMASPANYSKYISNTGIVWSKPQALFTGNLEQPEICLAANGMRAVNAQDDAFLQRVYDICNDPDVQTRIKLQPGQVLLINNRKGVHARTNFEANYDGNDRWLLRSNIRSVTWNMRHNIHEPEKYKVFA